MNDDQVRYINEAILNGFQLLAMSVSSAILMAGWTPDDPNVANNERAARAILAARAIVFDATSSAQAMRSGK